MDTLRPLLRLLGFVALTLPLIPVQQVFVWFWPAMALRLPHWYHRLVSHILGFHAVAQGPVPQQGPALIVSNHVSWIDIVLLSAVLPCSFVAKREVGRWPFFGTLARLQRSVFVDRDRRGTTGRSRDDIGERLKSGGIVVLFPEGTSGDGLKLLPFRSAYFGAADDPAIPVIPVTLAYTAVRGMALTRRERPSFAWYGDMDLAPHLWAALKAGPLTVSVIFHEPLRAENRHSRKEIAQVAHERIRRSLSEALHGAPGTR